MDITKADFDELSGRINRAEAYVKDWHDNVDRWRRLYKMQHYDRAAGKREIQYNDPTYTNTVDLAVGIMLGNSMRWHSYGMSPSSTEQRDTSHVEKLLNGILEASDEREEAFQRYRLFQNFVRDGGGVLYSVFDPEIANRSRELTTYFDDEANEQQVWTFKEVPIVTKVIDPKKFFCLPGGPHRWLVMGRYEKMTVLDAELKYGVKLNGYSHLSEDAKSQTYGVLKDVWDWVTVESPMMVDGQQVYNQVLGKPEHNKTMKVRNTVIFDNQPVRGPMIMEGYKDLPYTFQFFKPAEEDAEDWQSILTPLEGSVSMLERGVNRRSYQIDLYTGLPLVTKTQPGRKINIDPGLYNHINITPDETIEFPTWPGNAPDVEMHMNFLRSRIQQSGFSDVMFGSGQNQIAGYALSQLGDQNRIRLEQPIKHIELMLRIWAHKTLRLLMSFAKGTKICVFGHQRGIDFMDFIAIENLDGYRVRAEIRAHYPAEEQRKVAMATQSRGQLSNYTIMERFYDIEQPDDEEERMIIEQVSKHPAVLEYSVIKHLKERAEAGDEVAEMVLAKMQQGGVPGEPGRPQNPPNQAQLTGSQSPTGQPVPQAMGQTPGGSAAEQMSSMANEAPSLME